MRGWIQTHTHTHTDTDRHTHKHTYAIFFSFLKFILVMPGCRPRVVGY